MAKNIENYVTFKGLPLVKFGENFMIYGDMEQKAYADIIIVGPSENKEEYPGATMVTIKSTTEKDKVLRDNEFKNGMWETLNYAYEQIMRFNNK